MKNKSEVSKYISGTGNEVTLYKGESGRMATVVNGQITIYSDSGDMMCGMSSIEAMKTMIEFKDGDK